ncbi:VirK family protein [Allorhizobium sp. BGMRC 0089]|uniref:VirK family protein n=1 Tax=Allorhizobium sonneratiae TaxID=2934936 RepID=UPI0020348BC3|nr:VirK family protein [Allorhizobium sonneratiae]MCM2291858.1 VirK family protein [Allorhizobium sonneratiae]
MKAGIMVSSCFGLALIPMAAQASSPLPTSEALSTALMAGETVNVVVDLGKCRTETDPPRPGAMKGGLRISSFLERPDHSISFSDDHLTITSKDKKPIYQFVRYTVKPDNTVIYSMKILSVPEYKSEGGVFAYRCKLGDGVRFFTP